MFYNKFIFLSVIVWKVVSLLLTVKMFLTLELNSDINQINMLYYTYNCFVVVYKCNFCYNMLVGLVIWFMVFNATFNNISIISWQSVLLVEENGGHGKKDMRQVTNKLYHIMLYTSPNPLHQW